MGNYVNDTGCSDNRADRFDVMHNAATNVLAIVP